MDVKEDDHHGNRKQVKHGPKVLEAVKANSPKRQRQRSDGGERGQGQAGEARSLRGDDRNPDDRKEKEVVVSLDGKSVIHVARHRRVRYRTPPDVITIREDTVAEELLMSVNPVNSSIAAFAQRDLRFGFRSPPQAGSMAATTRKRPRRRM